MRIARKEFDNFAEWTYGGFYLIGIHGDCSNPLRSWPEACSPLNIEFGGVNEKLCDSLTAFSHIPLDMFFTQDLPRQEAFVFGWGLESDKDQIRNFTDGLTEKIGIIREIPGSELFYIGDNFAITDCRGNYRSILGVSSKFKVGIKQAFGAVRYSLFLSRYKKVPEEEAKKQAGKKYGFNL